MRTVPDTLTHERVAIFVDFRNTLNALRRAGRQIDLAALRDYLAEGRHLSEAFLYFGTHPLPDQEQAERATLDRLRQHGFIVSTKPAQLLPAGHLDCNFDLELALEAQEFAARTRPDIAVLVTPCDVAPLAQRLRLQGVRVEVASVPGSVSPALQAMANGFIDLTQIGAAVENLPIPEPSVMQDTPLPEGEGFELEEPMPVLA